MKWLIDRRSVVKFSTIISISLGVVGLSYLSVWGFWTTTQQVRQTQQALEQLEVVLSLVKDAETGQRGYLLAGQADYLIPYQTATAAMQQEIAALSQLLAHSPAQQEHLSRLKTLIAAKFSELEQTIALKQAQDTEAALQIVQTDQGRQLMRQIRALVATMKQQEQQALEQQTRLEQERGNLASLLTLGGIALEVLLVAGIVIQLNQEVSRVQASQTELSRSEQRYRSLITVMAQVVWVADSAGEMLSLTPSWFQITGQTRQEIKNWGWLKAVHPDDRLRVRQAWQEAVATKQLYEAECRIGQTDGSYRHFLVRGIPVAEARGKVREWVGVCIDISDRLQSEQALKQSHDQLEERVQERTQALQNANAALETEVSERMEIERQLSQLAANLQRSNQELEQFAYVASHDLQEPLRAVANYTQLLASRYSEHLDEKSEKYIRYVVDGASRMQQLINDLLSYSRVGRQTLTLQPIDSQVILTQVLASLQAVIHESQAQITQDPLPVITVDRSQFTQLLQNLISNAIKYRGEAPPRIHISAQQQQQHWLFSVQDNGIGIEPQYAERIFIIFQRLHTRRSYSGTGIGLSICKKIVEMHQGKIWVESQPGAGATFYFTLPYVSAPQPTTLVEVMP